MFTIDEMAWPYPCKIERVSEIRSSSVSGMMLDGSYFNDPLGQFMQYDIAIAVPPSDRDRYTAIYELITAPVDGHTFTLPYNGGTINVTGRIGNIKDSYVRLANGAVHWKGTSFTVTANHPTKAYSLGEAITRGRAPIPDVIQPAEGDTYMWRDGRWSHTLSYDNADLIRY